MADDELVVRSGQVAALRLFDIAYEIDLKRAEALWAARGQGAAARSRLVGTPPKAVSFGVPPLALDLGPMALDIAGVAVAAATSVRLYDFGIAALAIKIRVQDLPWSAFSALANDLDRTVGPATDSPVWEAMLADLRRILADALDQPTAAPLQEDYLLAVVDGFDQPVTADQLLGRVDLAPILSGRDRPLSEGARRDLLNQRFSYYPDDLAVITWDRAFLYEPQRETDVADVLEMANAQLLEMRLYDELLDAELPRMHALVKEARRRTNPLASSRRYARLAQRLYTLVAEVTALAERVDNALQVTQDVYLARVYAAAMELFRVRLLSAAVDRKLAIRETYSALYSEAAGGRAELLEIAVLVLIAVEIMLSLLGR
jgi:hypothetical protein